MKSARILTPILLLVLVLCMLALTFAWFSSGESNEVSSVLEAGTYVRVVFGDDGLLNNEPYNGQKGYRDDGVPYEDDDKAYQAYYHTSVKLQGDKDLYLRFEFSELWIEASSTFYMMSAGRTLEQIISKFEGYDPDKSHVGKVEKVVADGSEQNVFTEPSDGSVAFVYTDDGTLDGKVVFIRLDKANADKFFSLEYAKITATAPPYAYGTFAAEGEGLKYVYDKNAPLGTSEVASDAAYGKVNPICVRITYSDAEYAMTFPFSDESFKGSSFRFGVTAYANYS